MIKILKKQTYLTMIQNAVGTKLFLSLFAEENGETKDLLGGGKRSCAVLVSSVLYLFDLVESPRATVISLEHDLIRSGWHETDTPRPGDILFWEPMKQNGGINAHAGFCIGGGRAISNDWQLGVPIEHHITYGIKLNGAPARMITAVYTHEFIA